MSLSIRNDECLICHESLLKGIDLYRLLINDCLCYKCRSQYQSKLTVTKLFDYRLISFYQDSDELFQLLIRYKDFLDMPLAKVFLNKYMWLINLIFKDYKVVLIPSSKTLALRRGFNHLELMLANCKLEIVDCLEKSDQIQRFSVNRFDVKFHFKFPVNDLGNIIIFDDIITSGSSMIEAIKLLAPISKKIILMSITTNSELLVKRGV